jgi:hypothetical protein
MADFKLSTSMSHNSEYLLLAVASQSHSHTPINTPLPVLVLGLFVLQAFWTEAILEISLLCL